ncbi:hypothetical protein H1C71_042644 [Ictidomys tridecemlineatus]|nr:hypothetical protein H1C71_042644 [Ictidomys tridecemlineatus]
MRIPASSDFSSARYAAGLHKPDLVVFSTPVGAAVLAGHRITSHHTSCRFKQQFFIPKLTPTIYKHILGKSKFCQPHNSCPNYFCNSMRTQRELRQQGTPYSQQQ